MVRIDPNPIGHFDTLTASVGSLRVTGFVLDPDAYRAVSVDVYVDGVLATSVVANGYRPDVAAAYPHMGGEYGFDVTIAASPGFHNVCIVGRNANGGADLDLGCRATTVPSDPSGVVESVTSPGPGSARVRGWARDAGDGVTHLGAGDRGRRSGRRHSPPTGPGATATTATASTRPSPASPRGPVPCA